MQLAQPSRTVNRGAQPIRLGTYTLALLAIGTALFLVQAYVDPSIDNIYCVAISLVSTAITLGYCLNPAVFRRYPLSTLAIIGYCVTAYALALVAQTLYLRPLVFNLQIPRGTFTLSILLQAVLIVAHLAYRHVAALHRPAELLSRHVLRPLNCFRMPSRAELWVLGLLGLGATWIARVLLAGDIEYGDTGGKILDYIAFYQVMPGLILLRGAFSVRKAPIGPGTLALIAGYFSLIVLTSAALNSRGAFSMIVFDVGLAAVVAALLGRVRLSGAAKLKAGGAMLAILLLAPLASDLSTAMLAVRNERAALTPGQLISRTFEAFGDKALLERFAQSQGSLSGTFYSEYYIESAFLQRLTYTKYTDVQLNASSRFGENERAEVRQEFYNQLTSSIPTPILRALGSDLDKSTLFHSAGDFYDHLAYGASFGGFKTGSSIVNGRDVLSVFWIPGMFCLYILIFITLDAFSLRTMRGIVLSPIAFLTLYRTFTTATVADSLRVLVDQLGRGLIQTIVIYVVLSTLVRIGLSIVGGSTGQRPQQV